MRNHSIIINSTDVNLILEGLRRLTDDRRATVHTRAWCVELINSIKAQTKE